MANDTCSVSECEKPVKRIALCYGHYMKQWRYGTPTPAHAQRWEDLTGRRFGSLVAVERAGDGNRWLCKCDCGGESTPTVGSLNGGGSTTCGNRSAHNRSDNIAYCSAHDRVRSDRGKPYEYPCVDCGTRAEEWSYDHTDPNELYERLTVKGRWSYLAPYSTSPHHYSPRCVACHRTFDRQKASA